MFALTASLLEELMSIRLLLIGVEIWRASVRCTILIHYCPVYCLLGSLAERPNVSVRLEK